MGPPGLLCYLIYTRGENAGPGPGPGGEGWPGVLIAVKNLLSHLFFFLFHFVSLLSFFFWVHYGDW